MKNGRFMCCSSYISELDNRNKAVKKQRPVPILELSTIFLCFFSSWVVCSRTDYSLTISGILSAEILEK